MNGISKKLLDALSQLLKTWLCIAVVCMPLPAVAQHNDEALLKAVFIFNFAKFTRWPADVWNEESNEFRICALGKNSLTVSLEQLAGQKLKGRDVSVRHLDNLQQAESCQLLYIVQPDISTFNETNCCLPVLTISDAKGFASSVGMIELFIQEEKVRFNINLKVVRNSGMDINAQLLRLAKKVIQDPLP
jgi:hypothetical protein